MNKNLTEIVFILDRSGSMSGLEVTVKCSGGLKVTRENERIPPYRT